MVVLIALSTGTAHAAPPIRNGGNIGFGVGATTYAAGLDLKYWTGPSMSVQAVVGLYDPIRFDADALSFGTDADVLWELPSFTQTDDFDFGMDLGLGGVFGFTPDFDLAAGANLVVGFNFHIDAVPLDIVLDYRPTVMLLDAVGPNPVDVTGSGDTFRIDLATGGLHIRYWL